MSAAAPFLTDWRDPLPYIIHDRAIVWSILQSEQGEVLISDEKHPVSEGPVVCFPPNVTDSLVNDFSNRVKSNNRFRKEQRRINAGCFF